MARKNLKVYRVIHGLTQEQAASKVGVSRVTFAAIENGERDGTLRFWTKLQEAFEISDAEMWELVKNATEE